MFRARHIIGPILLRQSHIVPRQYNYAPLSIRTFSATPRPQAAEAEDQFIARFKGTSIYEKLIGNNEALVAIKTFADVLQKAGIDPASGMPSKMQMLRLASSKDFREAAKTVVSELQAAGVDLTSADAMQEIMGASKPRSGEDK